MEQSEPVIIDNFIYDILTTPGGPMMGILMGAIFGGDLLGKVDDIRWIPPPSIPKHKTLRRIYI